MGDDDGSAFVVLHFHDLEVWGGEKVDPDAGEGRGRDRDINLESVQMPALCDDHGFF